MSNQLETLVASSKTTPKKSKNLPSKCLNLNKLTYKAQNSNFNLQFNFTSGLYPSAYKTSSLIRAYLELDDRAKILAFCFRYIAKLAHIDKVDLCTLPPHSYILMAIYFLQKLNPPVLPVLHELIDSKKMTKSSTNGLLCENSPSKRTLSINSNKLDSTNEYLDENSFDEYNTIIDDMEFDSDQNAALQRATDKESTENFSIFRKNLNNYVSLFF